jgi:hypothetical protein
MYALCPSKSGQMNKHIVKHIGGQSWYRVRRWYMTCTTCRDTVGHRCPACTFHPGWDAPHQKITKSPNSHFHYKYRYCIHMPKARTHPAGPAPPRGDVWIISGHACSTMCHGTKKEGGRKKKMRSAAAVQHLERCCQTHSVTHHIGDHSLDRPRNQDSKPVGQDCQDNTGRLWYPITSFFQKQPHAAYNRADRGQTSRPAACPVDHFDEPPFGRLT